MANTFRLVRDGLEESEYFETFLLFGMTRTHFFIYNPIDDPNDLPDPQPLAPDIPDSQLIIKGYRNALVNVRDDEDLPMVGDHDDGNYEMFVKSVAIKPYSPRVGGDGFKAVVAYEGSTKRALWEIHGRLQQELTNFDKDGKVIVPPYKLTGANIPPGLNGNLRCADVPWYIPQRTARVTFYVPGQNAGNHLINTFLGKTNSDNWAGGGPRTWLCVQGDNTSQNGSLYRVTLDFAGRESTWDQVAVHLWMHNIKPSDFDPLPPRNQFPSSTLGIGDYAGNQSGHNGWVRCLIQGETDFAKTFICDPIGIPLNKRPVLPPAVTNIPVPQLTGEVTRPLYPNPYAKAGN